MTAIRAVWVLIIADDLVGEIMPTKHKPLSQNLEDALDIAEQMFPRNDGFRISVRNITDDSLREDIGNTDFDITNKKGKYIGEIEYWPNGYDPISLDDAIKQWKNLGGDVE